MSRLKLLSALAVAALAGFVLSTPAAQVTEGIREVFVTNFPDVQNVKGEVSIKGAVRLAELTSFENIIVPPVRRGDTTRMIEAGTLFTDGFPNVVLSLHGQVKGSVLRKGSVGAILIPVQEMIQLAFNEQGLMHFALEVAAADVSSDTPFFASTQPRHTVGFNAYRIFLYNTTDKTVTANLFTYLTN